MHNTGQGIVDSFGLKLSQTWLSKFTSQYARYYVRIGLAPEDAALAASLNLKLGLPVGMSGLVTAILQFHWIAAAVALYNGSASVGQALAGVTYAAWALVTFFLYWRHWRHHLLIAPFTWDNDVRKRMGYPWRYKPNAMIYILAAWWVVWIGGGTMTLALLRTLGVW